MKILLVEDDLVTRTMIEDVLTAHHYQVEVIGDGRSALELAQELASDLMLLDVNIPELDGISVCQQLRLQGCQIPILLLTAKDEIDDRIIGLDAGADDYMIKPFKMPELLARIRALLRRGRTTVESIVTWENLELNCSTHEISYRDRELRFTPKEYGILELLLLNPHRIFSRAALIARLWELETTPTESVINSHIKAIRHKLKTAGATQDLIEAVYGFGYRLRQVEIVATIDLAPADTIEVVDTLMWELWEQFKDSFGAEIDLLAATARTYAVRARELDRVGLGEDSPLEPRSVGVAQPLESGIVDPLLDLVPAARQVAHKLVGSLGVYGFPHGSILARQIEDLLSLDRDLTVVEIDRLHQLVGDLQQELDNQPQFEPDPILLVPVEPHIPTQGIFPSAQLPLVLVVDDDRILTDRLQAEAMGRSIEIEVAANLVAAQQTIETILPDLILLDLTFADSDENGLTWLATLKQQHPDLPVAIFTGRDRLVDRVLAARLGATAFLPKPMSADRIFAAISTALSATQNTKTHSLQDLKLDQIVVVDDDPAILHRLSIVLSPWGLQVTTLSDPRYFWELLIKTTPDLLILDIQMPEFSGIELCQAVRNDPHWGNLPILFLTAHQDAETIVQAFAAGGDDYIRKPILEPELIARVLHQLEPKQRHRQLSLSTILHQTQD
jgi:DNA-binding response OmpR family regulator